MFNQKKLLLLVPLLLVLLVAEQGRAADVPTQITNNSGYGTPFVIPPLVGSQQAVVNDINAHEIVPVGISLSTGGTTTGLYRISFRYSYQAINSSNPQEIAGFKVYGSNSKPDPDQQGRDIIAQNHVVGYVSRAYLFEFRKVLPQGQGVAIFIRNYFLYQRDAKNGYQYLVIVPYYYSGK